MTLAGPGELPNVLDVLENHLGEKPSPPGLRKLKLSELQEIGELLSELASAQSDQKIPGGASFLGGWLGAHWSEPSLSEDLGKSLLYYPNLLVLDPLADFFDDRSALPKTRPIRVRRRDGIYNTVTSGPSLWSTDGSFEALRENPYKAAARFSAIVTNLYALEDPIRHGVLVLRSQWPTISRRAQALAASVRHDIQSPHMQALAREPANSAEDAFAVWDNLRGASLSFDGPVAPADAPWETQHVFYYLAKTLAVADAAGAQYVPATERDLELLRLKSSSGSTSAHPSALLAEVARLVVPSFDIPIREAVAMRRSSEGFQDWRSLLDRIRRASKNDDPDELRERVRDELLPSIRAVELELKKSTVLRSLDLGAADVIFVGGVAAATAITTGGHPAASAAAAGISGVMSWIRRAYSREDIGGVNGVVAALVKGSRKSARQ